MRGKKKTPSNFIGGDMTELIMHDNLFKENWHAHEINHFYCLLYPSIAPDIYPYIDLYSIPYVEHKIMCELHFSVSISDNSFLMSWTKENLRILIALFALV